LDRVATYSAPVYVVGDFNVRLDRIDDPHAVQFQSLMAGYGLPLASSGPTHVRGGTLDAVASTIPVNVTVIDAGISDHHAICWSDSSPSAPTSAVPVKKAVPIRAWRRLDFTAFRAAIMSSRICSPSDWPADVDGLCAIYAVELNGILDQLLPLTQPSTKRRPTDPWFDKECRAAKQSTRRLERAHAAACRRSTSESVSSLTTRVANIAATKAAWYTQRREYRLLSTTSSKMSGILAEDSGI
jgi:hypothetical protein